MAGGERPAGRALRRLLRQLRAGLLLPLLLLGAPASADCDPDALDRLLELLGINALVGAVPVNARAWVGVMSSRHALDEPRRAQLQAAVDAWPAAERIHAGLMARLQPGCEAGRLALALEHLHRGGLAELRVALSIAGKGTHPALRPDDYRQLLASAPPAAERRAAVGRLLAANRTVDQLLEVNAAHESALGELLGPAPGDPVPGQFGDHDASLRDKRRAAQRAALGEFALDVHLYALRFSAADRIDAATAALMQPEVSESLDRALRQLALTLQDRGRSP